MSAKMPEQPKFVQLDPKWKPKGAHITTHVTWKAFIKMLQESGRLKEGEKVAALYAYSNGITLDIR